MFKEDQFVQGLQEPVCANPHTSGQRHTFPNGIVSMSPNKPIKVSLSWKLVEVVDSRVGRKTKRNGKKTHLEWRTFCRKRGKNNL